MTIIRRPTAFVLVSSMHGTMIVNRHDFKINADGTSVGTGVGYNLLETSCFDPEEVNLILLLLGKRRELFGSGVVAIDCGANVGVHTVEWSKFMYGWGSVIAFEPQERIFYALAGNVSINNCFNATLHYAAVGAKSGMIDIPQPDYFKASSFGSLELRGHDHNEFIGQPIDYSPQQCKSIPLMSIDALNLSRIDLIKIDVEGMELEVLEGAKESIRKFKPQVFMEYFKSDKNKLLRFLEDEGYKSFYCEPNVLSIHENDPTLVNLRFELTEARAV